MTVVVVMHPTPMVKDRGRVVKRRRVDVRINVVVASLPGPPRFSA